MCDSLRWELCGSNYRRQGSQEPSGWRQRSRLGLQCKGIGHKRPRSSLWCGRKAQCIILDLKLEEADYEEDRRVLVGSQRGNQNLGFNTLREWIPETTGISYTSILLSTSRQEPTLADSLIWALWDLDHRNQSNCLHKLDNRNIFKDSGTVAIVTQQ